jgi:hypothetical protein
MPSPHRPMSFPPGTERSLESNAVRISSSPPRGSNEPAAVAGRDLAPEFDGAPHGRDDPKLSSLPPVPGSTGHGILPPPSVGDRADPATVTLPDVRLVARRVLRPARCRCGTQLEMNGLALAVDRVPELVVPLFEGKLFCGYPCIRAEFLELLETLDAMVGSPGEETVTDLRPTYAQLAREFASLLHE